MNEYPYYEGNILVESYSETLEQRTLTIDGVRYKLRQVETGVSYDDPIDVIPCPYNYEETNEVIEEKDIETRETEE